MEIDRFLILSEKFKNRVFSMTKRVTQSALVGGNNYEIGLAVSSVICMLLRPW